jgi:hypothetical protein
MRGRLLLAGTAASFGLVFLPGLTHAAGAATCGYPAASCSEPQLTSNGGSSSAGGSPANAAVSPSSSGASAPSGGLPFTGADVAELSAIGVAALGAGTLLLRRGRHSHA